MKKLLGLVLVLGIAGLFMFGPLANLFGGPQLAVGPAPPSGAIAFAYVPLVLTHSSGGYWSINIDGDLNSLVYAKPIAEYHNVVPTEASGGVSGGSGQAVQYHVSGTVYVGSSALAWAIPEHVFSGRTDSVGQVNINSPVAFFMTPGNYAISGNVLVEAISVSSGQVLGDFSVNAAISGDVQVH